MKSKLKQRYDIFFVKSRKNYNILHFIFNHFVSGLFIIRIFAIRTELFAANQEIRLCKGG